MSSRGIFQVFMFLVAPWLFALSKDVSKHYVLQKYLLIIENMNIGHLKGTCNLVHAVIT